MEATIARKWRIGPTTLLWGSGGGGERQPLCRGGTQRDEPCVAVLPAAGLHCPRGGQRPQGQAAVHRYFSRFEAHLRGVQGASGQTWPAGGVLFLHRLHDGGRRREGQHPQHLQDEARQPAQKSSLDDWIDFPAGAKTWRKLRYTGSQEFCVKDKGGTETFQTMPGVFTVYVLEESGQVVIVAFRAPEPRTAGGTRPVGASGGRQRCRRNEPRCPSRRSLQRQPPLAGGRAGHDALGQRQRVDRTQRPAVHQALGRGLRRSCGRETWWRSTWRAAGGRPAASCGRASICRTTCISIRNMPEIGGIIHTHSNYATAFAAAGRPIPLVPDGDRRRVRRRKSPAAPTSTTKATTSARRFCGTATGRRRYCWPTMACLPGAIRPAPR